MMPDSTTMLRVTLIVLGTLLALAGLAIWVLRHALATARAKPAAGPTPEQKRIDDQSAASVVAIDAAAAKAKKEVANATGRDLADKFSDRMLKPK